MKLHANAPLGPKGRKRLVLRVLEEREDRRQMVRPYREEGEAGLLDRSSAPRRVHNATSPDRVEAITALRRLHVTAPRLRRPWRWRPPRSPRY